MIKTLLNKIFSRYKINTKNKMDISTKYTHISFDASIMKNGNLGIGMYDITNNKRIARCGKVSKMSSIMGESKALEFVLKYSHENNFEYLTLFTDNIELARRDLTKYTKQYNFKEVHLTWIPRQLNREADKFSKEGQELHKDISKNKSLFFTGACANETTIKKASSKSKSSKRIKSNNKGLRIVEKRSLNIFSKYNYEQKVKMLSALSDKNSIDEQEFIRFIKQGTKENYRFNITKENITFISMAKTLLIHDKNSSRYVKSRFTKMRDPITNYKLSTLSYDVFEREFDKRKPKRIEKVITNSYMMEMVENLRKVA